MIDKLPTFKKSFIEKTKGRQPSKYDVWLEEFKQPGDSLQFSEKSEGTPDGMSRQQAAQIAARFRDLTYKPFHSFFDVRERKVTIRLRLPSEVTTEKKEDELEVEDE